MMSTFTPPVSLKPSLPGVPVHVDSDGRIATGLACLHCGYDLRGLELDDTCPECGIPIRTTLRGDRLGDAPPAWLCQLRRGARIAQVGTLLTPLLAPLPVAVIGLWMITSPQPGRAEPSVDERYRWSGRMFLVAGASVLVALMTWIAAILVIRPRELLTRVGGYADAVGIAGFGLFVLGFLAITVHLATLAQRIPDVGLLARIRSAQRQWFAGLGVLVAIAITAQVINQLYLANRVAYRPWTAAVFFAAVAAMLLWLWIVTLRLLGALRRGLDTIASGDGDEQ